MVVYPKVIKVSKGLYDTMKAKVKAGISAIGNWFRSSTQTEEDKGVEFKLPSKEELAVQCLQFYLEPMKGVLLQDGEYPKEYKVDFMVTEIVHIYSVISEPWMDGDKWTIPLMATVSTTL